MRIALLGADAGTLDLARAVVESQEHLLVWACELGEAAGFIESLAARVQLAEHWEGLLSGDVADAVIVARADDDDWRAEQLRKLVQAAVPMLTSHPVHESMLLYYELEMIREETGSVLLPYVPTRQHPAVAQIADWVRAGLEGPLGSLEQVVFERSLAERGRRTVLAHFVRDMELARAWCGQPATLAAMGPQAAGPDELFANLGVQMSVAGGRVVRWSVSRATQQAGLRINLLGTRGTVVLVIPDADEPWMLETSVDGDVARRPLERLNGAAAELERLEKALSGQETGPSWLDAAHGMELADTIEHSLERGRTLPLYYEGPSEQSTFKGLMSGVGCFLLVGGLVFTVLATTAVNMGVPLAQHWPYVLLALLGTFLLLQLLRLAFPHEKP